MQKLVLENAGASLKWGSTDILGVRRYLGVHPHICVGGLIHI